METKANYALIGAFTLSVIAAAFGFVLWFSGGDKQANRAAYRIVFSSSVSGLSRGVVVVGVFGRIDVVHSTAKDRNGPGR